MGENEYDTDKDFAEGKNRNCYVDLIISNIEGCYLFWNSKQGFQCPKKNKGNCRD